ncbi:GreA/GreB family elongation factor [Faecalibacter rhinopitheci]|uniref:GreA/GreB family elongation factor n=1 Tax=Faecalibacter rhinopitheci TaxID=2779678 RepID=A0A8J7FMU5_9FLAO|nr:GreA/GreB family elongation factor [Faecalibacter rhinopitheci]MBF0597307.1 GreA/GreB family elongation factor [Faecalibacter rhinopitheci]MBQ0146930.1 GreA/GreB family elongation factor [Candidatus Onthonaster equi]
MSTNVILTTGIYDLLKDHLRRKKVTKEQEAILLAQLKSAKQVLRRDLPSDIVTVNTKIKVKELTENKEFDGLLVSPNKANYKKQKYSILSDLGLAILGKRVGETIDWPMADGVRKYQIVGSEPLS